MLIFSLLYLVLIIVIFEVYYSVANKYKPYVLFFASIIFITSISLRVAIFSVLFATLNYFLGLLLFQVREKKKIKNNLFWLSIAIDVGFLSFFKYSNFFSGSIDSLFSLLKISLQIPHSNIIL